MGCLYGVGRRYSGHEISYLSVRLGAVGYMSGPCCYQAMSKLITVKSMVGVMFRISVLCKYTEV